MTRVLAAVFASIFVVAPLAQGTADAKPHRGKPVLVKVKTTAEGAGAIATATPTCPLSTPSKRPGRTLGKWRAVSGGFDLDVGDPSPTPPSNPPPWPIVRSGDAVVYESQKVGQRSWRVSAQNRGARSR